MQMYLPLTQAQPAFMRVSQSLILSKKIITPPSQQHSWLDESVDGLKKVKQQNAAPHLQRQQSQIQPINSRINISSCALAQSAPGLGLPQKAPQMSIPMMDAYQSCHTLRDVEIICFLEEMTYWNTAELDAALKEDNMIDQEMKYINDIIHLNLQINKTLIVLSHPKASPKGSPKFSQPKKLQIQQSAAQLQQVSNPQSSSVRSRSTSLTQSSSQQIDSSTWRSDQIQSKSNPLNSNVQRPKTQMKKQTSKQSIESNPHLQTQSPPTQQIARLSSQSKQRIGSFQGNPIQNPISMTKLKDGNKNKV
ncbi:MAG: hypothetical protein EZS28_002383 [Streblomastix strix]|uniref:Uncharacterized protein n=1 Tax=Streblomastix strix TaxID=222440 RepID=A0A5J4X446_9EUKA|nr:MAG: hypothetical protein EZS28_002383 [Streblomastix strix]